MQLLNQLRADAGKIADEAIPEVVTAVDQLVPPTSLAKVVVALIGRLEQDIPGLVHVETERLPHPLTTPVAEPEPAAVVPPNPAPVAPVQAAPAPVAPAPVATAQEVVVPPTPENLAADLARVQQELRQEREAVAALQAAQTPAPEAAPVVSTATQEAPVA